MLHPKFAELDIKPTQQVSCVDDCFTITYESDNAQQDLQYVSSLDTIELLDISQASTTNQY